MKPKYYLLILVLSLSSAFLIDLLLINSIQTELLIMIRKNYHPAALLYRIFKYRYIVDIAIAILIWNFGITLALIFKNKK